MAFKSLRKFEEYFDEENNRNVMYFGNLAITDDLQYIGYSNVNFIGGEISVAKKVDEYFVMITRDDIDCPLATIRMSRSKNIEMDNKFDTWLKEHNVEFLDLTKDLKECII